MRKDKVQYMAVDQYGQTYHGLTHPRKELCEKLGVKHVDRMYIDMADGSVKHIGYVIGGLWFRLYEVRPVYREV
jgi:hypothetical protein